MPLLLFAEEIVHSKPFLISVLLAASITSQAAAATSSLLPAVGASQTFTVASHTDRPFHHPPEQNGMNQPPPGAPQGGGEHEHFGAFMRDQNGTLTLARITASIVALTTAGDIDQMNSPLTVTSQGTIDPGTTPDRFVVALDNASALAAELNARTPWQASIAFLTPAGVLHPVAMTAKTVSVNGSTTKLQATGTASFTLQTPRGDRLTEVDATVDEQLTAGRLSAYTQTFVQTVTTFNGDMKITNITSLAAQ